MAVRKRHTSGRVVTHRMFTELSIPSDFLIPTCQSCGAEDIDEKTAAELAKVTAAAFADELRRRGQHAVAKVCEVISQRRLEKLLGLSQGYLSRVYRDKGTPSAALVALLTLLAHEPHQRLREIARDWDEPFPSDRQEISHGCESCNEPFARRGA